MAISLQKGQRVDLTKGNAGLSKIMVGLGWDQVNNAGGGGFLSSVFGNSGGGTDIDCDASVIMLDQNGKMPSKSDLIYFGNLKSVCGSIVHTGDNRTGEGDGDDEQIIVDLSKVPSHIDKLVFVVNIYACVKRKQHFGMIRNAFIRIVDSANKELIRFNLTDNYSGKTCLYPGEVYRSNGEWKFAAIGEATNDTGLEEVIRRYR